LQIAAAHREEWPQIGMRTRQTVCSITIARS
jgi:hypothetical protein